MTTTERARSSRTVRRSACTLIAATDTPGPTGPPQREERALTAADARRVLSARVYDSESEQGEAIGVWAHHYDYHRPHTACSDQPPASRLRASVDNFMINYS